MNLEDHLINCHTAYTNRNVIPPDPRIYYNKYTNEYALSLGSLIFFNGGKDITRDIIIEFVLYDDKNKRISNFVTVKINNGYKDVFINRSTTENDYKDVSTCRSVKIKHRHTYWYRYKDDRILKKDYRRKCPFKLSSSLCSIRDYKLPFSIIPLDMLIYFRGINHPAPGDGLNLKCNLYIGGVLYSKLKLNLISDIICSIITFNHNHSDQYDTHQQLIYKESNYQYSCCCNNKFNLICSLHYKRIIIEIQRILSCYHSLSINYKQHIHKYLLYFYLQILYYAQTGHINSCQCYHIPNILLTFSFINLNIYNCNSPHDVQSTSSSTSTRGRLADSSSNYLSLKSIATPGDRGGSEGGNVTSSGLPAADLREAEGEVKGRGTTPSGETSGGTSCGNISSVANHPNHEAPLTESNVVMAEGTSIVIPPLDINKRLITYDSIKDDLYSSGNESVSSDVAITSDDENYPPRAKNIQEKRIRIIHSSCKSHRITKTTYTEERKCSTPKNRNSTRKNEDVASNKPSPSASSMTDVEDVNMNTKVLLLPSILNWLYNDNDFYIKMDTFIICDKMMNILLTFSDILSLCRDRINLCIIEPDDFKLLKILTYKPLYGIQLTIDNIDDIMTCFKYKNITYRYINMIIWKYSNLLSRGKNTLPLFLRFLNLNNNNELIRFQNILNHWTKPNSNSLLELLSSDFNSKRQFLYKFLINWCNLKFIKLYLKQIIFNTINDEILYKHVIDTCLNDINTSIQLYWILTSEYSQSNNHTYKNCLKYYESLIQLTHNNEDSPPEVQSTSDSTRRGASFNYPPVNGNATPGDRGGSEGGNVTSSGLPAADLREAEGEIYREAPCNGKDGPQVDVVCKTTLDVTSCGGSDVRVDLCWNCDTMKCSVLVGEYIRLQDDFRRVLMNISRDLEIECPGRCINKNRSLFRIVSRHFNDDSDMIRLNNVPLFTNPNIHLKFLLSNECKVVLSKRYPLVIKTLTNDNKIIKMMYKYGDDLSQDNLCQLLIKIINKIIKSYRLKSYLLNYNVTILSKIDGCIEFIPNSITLYDLLNKYKNINNFLNTYAHYKSNTSFYTPPEVSPAVSSSNYLSLKSKATPGDRGEGSEDVTSSGEPVADLREAKGEVNKGSCLQDEESWIGLQVESCLQDKGGTSCVINVVENRIGDWTIVRSDCIKKWLNFIYSLADYSVFTYIFGVGDRHYHNILMTYEGLIVHVDYSFIFGDDPTPLPQPPFKLSKEFINTLGGVESKLFKLMIKRFIKIFKIIRLEANLILQILYQSIQFKLKNLNIEKLNTVKEKLLLDLNEKQLEEEILNLINKSANSISPFIIDTWHIISSSWK